MICINVAADHVYPCEDIVHPTPTSSGEDSSVLLPKSSALFVSGEIFACQAPCPPPLEVAAIRQSALQIIYGVQAFMEPLDCPPTGVSQWGMTKRLQFQGSGDCVTCTKVAADHVYPFEDMVHPTPTSSKEVPLRCFQRALRGWSTAKGSRFRLPGPLEVAVGV